METTISVLNYNIWFSEENRTERTISLLNTIDTHNPDIICLQEVTQPVYEHLKQSLNLYPYFYPSNNISAYDCAIFSKHKFTNIKVHPFNNSIMGRKLITVNIDINDHQLVIATAHFESLFKQNNKQKIEQYDFTHDILKQFNNIPVILCADTNLMAHEENLYLTKHNMWNDCWIIDGKNKDKEYTYDTSTNDNLVTRNIHHIQSRIDRITYNDKLTMINFNMIKGSDFYIEPSDHYGVMATFALLEAT